MQNIMENYRLALAARRAARKAEAKAHKHARRELMHRSAEFWRERAEQAIRISERNEFAGLTRLADITDYPTE